jgi:membrane protease YdiL (CAAX protease family)
MDLFEKIDKRITYIIKGILVFTFFYYSAYLQYIPVILFKLDIHNISDSTQVLLSTFSSIIVSLVLLLVYRKDLKEDFIKFKSNLLKNLDTGLLCWFIGLLVMFASNILINILFKTGGAENENTVQTMIKSFPALMAINATFLAPFNEELVFRKTLKDVFSNKWVLMILSFLLFGGAHVIGSKTLVDFLYIIPYGSLGAAFALAYYKTDTVFTSMTCHMLHNGILTAISIATYLL